MLFRSDEAAFCEKYILKNTGEKPLYVEIPRARSVIRTAPAKGVEGSYELVAEICGDTALMLAPRAEVAFGAFFSGRRSGDEALALNADAECAKRRALVAEWQRNLVLDTPDPVIDAMFAFAKIRAAESIYDTKGGLMHGPGGERFYAAIWANDQAEYINPFFPFLGYDRGNRSALCSFGYFARYMNPDYRPIPSSIIAEGTDIWNGAGDRGDAAMIAYGAARYALARGDAAEAAEVWPLVEWCLEYCRRRLTGDGVVASDSDELEGRFPAGDANLCTSSLYYDALLSAAMLGRELHKPARQLAAYERQAAVLRKNIDRHFGGMVDNGDGSVFLGGIAPNVDILAYGAFRDGLQLLVHHRNAAVQCIKRALDLDLLPLINDLAFVHVVDTKHALHQGRLARAVLSHQRMDGAGFQ